MQEASVGQRGARWISQGLIAAALVGAQGCKDTPPSPSATTAVSATKDPQSAPLPGPLPPIAKVGLDDCEAWARHAITVTIDSVRDALNGCPNDPNQAFLQKLVGEEITIRGGAAAACQKHLNQEYSTASAACFNKATTAKALLACKLGPMTNADDVDLDATIEKMRATCKASLSAASSAPTK